MQKSIIETVVEERIFVAYYNYEFKYALADEIDEIIKLEINDTHFMSFNRDDDRHKGVVVRVS